jgi:hypothetical protein
MSWCGMRGIVSRRRSRYRKSRAEPPSPARSFLIIFLTFVVITDARHQGLSLKPLIRHFRSGRTG